MSPVAESTDAPTVPVPASASSLPNETLDFANKMFDLARQGNMLLMDYILAGLPTNLTNNRGDTILMLACYHGHHQLAQALLEAGSDPNQLNGKDQSCLAGAVFKSHEQVIRVLVQHNADPEAGAPSASQTADMFKKTEYSELFTRAPGRGSGARYAAAEVEDREEARRLPGVGLTRTLDTEQDNTAI